MQKPKGDRGRAADWLAGSRTRPEPFKLLCARPSLSLRSTSPVAIGQRTPEHSQDNILTHPPEPALRQSSVDAPRILQPVMPVQALGRQRTLLTGPLPDVTVAAEQRAATSIKVKALGSAREKREGLVSAAIRDLDEVPTVARNISEDLPTVARNNSEDLHTIARNSSEDLTLSEVRSRRSNISATGKSGVNGALRAEHLSQALVSTKHSTSTQHQALVRDGEAPAREKGQVDAVRKFRGTLESLKTQGASRSQHPVSQETPWHAKATMCLIERTRSRSTSPNLNRQASSVLLTRTRSRSSSPPAHHQPDVPVDMQKTPRSVRRLRRRERGETWHMEQSVAYDRLSRVARCFSMRDVRICLYSWQLQAQELAKLNVLKRRADELEEENDRMQRWLQSTDKLQAEKAIREALAEGRREASEQDADCRVQQLTTEIKRIKEESARVIAENARRHSAEQSLKGENETLRADLAKLQGDNKKLVDENATLRSAQAAQHNASSAPGGACVNAQDDDDERVQISREELMTMARACKAAGALKQELVNLKAAHSMLLARDGTAGDEGAGVREGKNGRGASGSMCNECRALQEQLQTQEREVTQTKKMLQAAKIQLASRIGMPKVDNQQDGLEALLEKRNDQLAKRDARIKELEDAAQDFERQMTSVKLEFHNHLIGKTMKDFNTTCSSSQTEPPRVSPHTRWLWLLSLHIQMLSNRNREEPGVAAKALAPIKVLNCGVQCGAKTADAACITVALPEVKIVSDETLWWDEVVTKIEKQMLDTADEGQGEGGGVTQSSHLGAARFGTWLSDRGILQIISNVYEEKLVADYVCRRKREPIQPLPSFVWNFMLCQYGDRVNAAAAMQQLVGSVLRRVRVHPVRSGNRLPQARHRMLMFARFLGFNEMDASGKHVGPLSLTELEVYLIMLGIARQGQCPLLEAGMSQMQADKDVLHSIVDVVFRDTEDWDRGAMKTHINDAIDTVAGEGDIESILRVLLDNWHSLDSRWSSRLEALFMAHDADGDGNLDVGEFSNMLQKVVEGESAWHNLLLHRRMYSNMCMWPRVDASVFVKVARDHAFEAMSVEDCADAAGLPEYALRLQQSLIPTVKDILKEGKSPQVAHVVFHQVLHQCPSSVFCTRCLTYAQGCKQRLLKRGELLPGSKK